MRSETWSDPSVRKAEEEWREFLKGEPRLEINSIGSPVRRSGVEAFPERTDEKED